MDEKILEKFDIISAIHENVLQLGEDTKKNSSQLEKFGEAITGLSNGQALIKAELNQVKSYGLELKNEFKILDKRQDEANEKIIRLDERQKILHENLHSHINNQMKRDTDWDSRVTEIAKKTVETESMLMQNKILKWLVYHTIFIVGWIALGVIGIIGYLINKGVIK